MAMGGPDDIQDMREILGDIVQAGLHASAVIDRVRSMVKNEQRGAVSFDITNAIRDVVLLLHSDAVMRKISVSLQAEPEMPAVQGDRVQLQQVVLNLLLNAFDAMKDSDRSDRTVLLDIARPKLIALAADEGDVDLAVAELGEHLDGAGLASLEPGMALEA